MAEIVRYQHTDSDRIREVLATSSERVIYDRSPLWDLIEDAPEGGGDGDEETWVSA